MTASYVITPGSSAVQLSAATGGPPANSPTGGYSYVAIQALAANTGILYIGGANVNSSTSSTNYGQRIEIPVTSIPAAPTVIEVARGNIDLADIWVKASVNSDKFSVLCIAG